VRILNLFQIRTSLGGRIRLLQVFRLRIKDIDFPANEIIIHGGKGNQDRRIMLPEAIKPDLMARVQKLPTEDLAAGYGRVYLPTPSIGNFQMPPRDGSGNTFSHRVKSRLIHDPEFGDDTTPTKPQFRGRSRQPFARRGSSREPRPIRSATVLPRTCSKRAMISALFRNFWATPVLSKGGRGVKSPLDE